MKSHSLNSRGFTQMELLCVLGIVGILAAIIVPAIITSRKKAHASTCLSHQRQWGVALLAYTQDYDGAYPALVTATFTGRKARGGTSWYSTVKYYTNNHLFVCPSRSVSDIYKNRTYTCGYALNSQLNAPDTESKTFHYEGRSEAVISAQANVVTVLEARAGIIAKNQPDVFDPDEVIGIYNPGMQEEIMAQTPGAIRHSGGANYVFADGHAKWFLPNAFTIDCDGTRPCFEP